MKEKSNVWLAVALMLLLALTRWPGLLPSNFSAVYAMAFCTGLYFRGRHEWLLPLGTMVLNVTNQCNLACTYCYEYGEDKVATPPEPGESRRARMTDATARESIDFLLRSSADRPQVSITFFGGETLLNFPAIRAARLPIPTALRAL